MAPASPLLADSPPQPHTTLHHIVWYDERFEEIAEMAKEEGVTLNPASVRHCRDFLSQIAGFTKKPAITANAEGAITTTWGIPPDRHLGVRFLPNGQIAYLLVPHEHPEKANEWESATTNPQRLLSILERARHLGIPA